MPTNAHKGQYTHAVSMTGIFYLSHQLLLSGPCQSTLSLPQLHQYPLWSPHVHSGKLSLSWSFRILFSVQCFWRGICFGDLSRTLPSFGRPHSCPVKNRYIHGRSTGRLFFSVVSTQALQNKYILHPFIHCLLYQTGQSESLGIQKSITRQFDTAFFTVRKFCHLLCSIPQPCLS